MHFLFLYIRDIHWLSAASNMANIWWVSKQNSFQFVEIRWAVYADEWMSERFVCVCVCGGGGGGWGGRVGPLNLTARKLRDEPTGFHDNRAESWSVHKSVVNTVIFLQAVLT